MNKYVVRASLMLLGELALACFILFLVYLVLTFTPVEFVMGVFFFIMAVVIVTFVYGLISAAKDYVISKARYLAKKDGFKDGIHV